MISLFELSFVRVVAVLQNHEQFSMRIWNVCSAFHVSEVGKNNIWGSIERKRVSGIAGSKPAPVLGVDFVSVEKVVWENSGHWCAVAKAYSDIVLLPFQNRGEIQCRLSFEWWTEHYSSAIMGVWFCGKGVAGLKRVVACWMHAGARFINDDGFIVEKAECGAKCAPWCFDWLQDCVHSAFPFGCLRRCCQCILRSAYCSLASSDQLSMERMHRIASDCDEANNSRLFPLIMPADYARWVSL